MPWNDQKGGGGPRGGPGGDGGSPWGRGGGNGGGGGDGQSPDLEESLKRMQQRWRSRRGGGSGSGGGRRGRGLGGAGFAILFVAAVVGWLLTGLFTVDEREQAVVLQFGEFHSTRGPGFHIRLPDPIQSHQIVSMQRQSVSIGARSNESQMLTGDENIVDVKYEVQWRVNSPQQFLFNVDQPELALRQVVESAMREVIGKRDLQTIITSGRAEVAEAARVLLQEKLDAYGAGIFVEVLNIEESDAPEPVRAAFRDVASAVQDKETTINEATRYANERVPRARGDAQRIIQEAEAYRESVVAQANGEAARFLSIYEEYRQAPRVTRERMFLETMEKVLSESDQIILDSESGVLPYLPVDQLRRQQSGQGG